MIRLYLLFLYLIPIALFAQNNIGCGVTTLENISWQCVGPFHNNEQITNQNFGAIAAICVNPNNTKEIYIGTYSAGLWYTNNEGNTWQNITRNYNATIGGVWKIYVDFDKKERNIYLATGSEYLWSEGVAAGILYSNDGGVSWQKSIFPDMVWTISSPLIKHLERATNNKNIFYCNVNGAVFKSVNSCKSFELFFPTTNEHNSIYNRVGYHSFSSIALASDNSTLLLSTNSKTWWDGSKAVELPNQFIQLKNVHTNSVTATDITTIIESESGISAKKYCGGVIISSCKSANNIMHIFRTYGNNGEPITIEEYNVETNKIDKHISPYTGREKFDAEWFCGITCCANNPKKHYLSGTMLALSTDNKQRFPLLYNYSHGENNIPHADIRSTVYVPLKDSVGYIYLGTDGGLSLSTDGGKTFKNLNGKQLPITEFYGLDVHPVNGKVTLGAQDNGFATYNPATKLWKFAINGDGYDVEYNLKDTNLLLGATNSQQLIVSHSGEVPLDNFYNLHKRGESPQVGIIKCLPNGSNYYLGGNNIYCNKFKDKEWSSTSVPNIGNFIFAYDVCAANTNIMYAANVWNEAKGGLLKTIDGGDNWQDISSNVKIAGNTNFSISSYRIHKILCHPNNEDEIWICLGYKSDYMQVCNGVTRVIYSADGGSTFVDYSEGLSVFPVLDLVYLNGSNGQMIAATSNGIYCKNSYYTKWALLGSNQPKAIISELKVDYTNSKLYASTYGNGLWCMDIKEYINIGSKTIKATIADTAITYNGDYLYNSLDLSTKAKLIITQPLYVMPGRKISMYSYDQIQILPTGKLISLAKNDKAIIIIKPSKKWWMFW